MRVVILSQYFAPEPIPKPLELAESLMARGHDVAVVTGFPNYPSGKLYDGHRLRLWKRERAGQVPVLRTFEYPYHGLRVLGRGANYLSFAASAMLALAMVKRPDVLYVWHPPLTIGLPAWLLSRLWRAPFVLDVQDIWPDTAIHVGALQPGAVTSALHVLERFVYRRAAHVITTTSAARENLLEKGVPPGKVTALPHWIDPGEWRAPMHERDAARDALGWRDRFVTLHAGNIGLLQALESVVAAAGELDRRFLLVIVGDGSERARLESLVAARGLTDRVQFLPRRPPSDMPRLYAAADALLVHLKRSMFALWSVPTKTLAYLSSGRPLIVATEGPSIDLVERARAGLVAPPESPEALARTIRALAAYPESERLAMGERGRAFVSAHLSRGKVVPQYEALLRAAIVNSRQ